MANVWWVLHVTAALILIDQDCIEVTQFTTSRQHNIIGFRSEVILGKGNTEFHSIYFLKIQDIFCSFTTSRTGCKIHDCSQGLK